MRTNKFTLAASIMGMLTPSFAIPTVNEKMNISRNLDGKPKGGKGQIRSAKPKPSGVAAMKRAAKKRRNIRKHS